MGLADFVFVGIDVKVAGSSDRVFDDLASLPAGVTTRLDYKGEQLFF